MLLSDGFAADPLTGSITMEKYKYLHNLIQMPFVLILFLAGVVGVLSGIGISILQEKPFRDLVLRSVELYWRFSLYFLLPDLMELRFTPRFLI